VPLLLLLLLLLLHRPSTMTAAGLEDRTKAVIPRSASMTVMDGGIHIPGHLFCDGAPAAAAAAAAGREDGFGADDFGRKLRIFAGVAQALASRRGGKRIEIKKGKHDDIAWKTLRARAVAWICACQGNNFRPNLPPTSIRETKPHQQPGQSYLWQGKSFSQRTLDRLHAVQDTALLARSRFMFLLSFA